MISRPMGPLAGRGGISVRFRANAHAHRINLGVRGERASPERRPFAGLDAQPGLTTLLLINAIELAINDATSVMLPGTIIVLLVLASAW